MSRVIKFRARDTKENKWLFDSPEGFSMFGEMVIMGEWGAAAWRSISDDEPRRYVLQQYTGLKDKNEVDIYDGDILTELGHTKKVEWSEEGAGWVFIVIGDCKNNYSASIEVIGNIYSNPELLSKEPLKENTTHE